MNTKATLKKSSIFRIPLFLILLCTNHFLFGQFKLEFQEVPNVGPKVINPLKVTQYLRNPYIGGFSCPIFSQIDVDNDGVKDLYIFDHQDSTLTIMKNEGNSVYSFRPDWTAYFPSVIDWGMLRDYNNDGLPDIFAYNRYLGGSFEVYKNVTQTGRFPKFKMIKDELLTLYIPQFGNNTNVYSTHATMPFVGNVDNDGDLDVISSDGSGNQMTFYPGFLKDTFGITYSKYDSLYFKYKDEVWGCFQGSANSSNIPDTGYYVPDLHFRDGRFYKKKHAGMNLFLFDADNDGDMDVIHSNINGSKLTFLKNGKSEKYGPNSKFDTIVSADTTMFKENIPYFPGVTSIDFDLDGDQDLVATPMDGTNTWGKNTTFLYENTNNDKFPKFKVLTNAFIEDEMIDEGNYSSPAFYDSNNDGRPEFMLVATYGYGPLSKNKYSKLVKYDNVGKDTIIIFKKVSDDYLNINALKFEGVFPSFGDINNDKKQDLLLGTADGKLKLFLNTSTSTNINFSYFPVKQFDTLDIGSYLTPALVDMNLDGKKDLVIGNSEGTLNYLKWTKIKYSVKGVPEYEFVTDTLGSVKTRDPQDYTGHSTPSFIDLDNNNVLDMISGSSSGDFYVYMNIQGKDKPEDIWIQEPFNFVFNGNTKFKEKKNFGNNCSPAAALLDSDSFPDIFIGNRKGGLRFLKNTSKGRVGIENQNISNIDFQVFPNPAKDIIRIELPTNASYSYKIMDIQGKVLEQSSSFNKSNLILNISTFKNGMYFIEFHDGTGKSGIKKWVKE